MSEPIHIISLGAGVQSSTMALMAAAGEITPMPQCAIFADTQDEPGSVYKWIDWLENELPFPVYRVTSGKLSEHANRTRTNKLTGRRENIGGVPLFIATESTPGPMARRCTKDFKIIPIVKAARKLGGIRRGQKTIGVIQWIGISVDEIHRAKYSREPWMKNIWPLMDLRMSRADCLRWMSNRGYPEPPRSACVFCPFHSDREWRRLRDDEPEEFKKAIAFEIGYQTASNTSVLKTIPFLHRSLVPLDKVDFSTEEENGQGNFLNECEGMCGV